MAREFDVCGLGNSLVDILLELTDEEFAPLAFERGTMRLVEADEGLFVEGYLFANPRTGQHAVREAIRAAKAHGVKVALTCSDAFVPQVFGDAFKEALKQSDLLFCNAGEANAVAGGSSAADS